MKKSYRKIIAQRLSRLKTARLLLCENKQVMKKPCRLPALSGDESARIGIRVKIAELLG